MTERFLRKIFKPTMVDDFRVRRTIGASENSYKIPALFPHLRSLRRQTEGRMSVAPKTAEVDLLTRVFSDAEQMGMDLGKRDSTVHLLRVNGVNYNYTSKENPFLVPSSLLIRVKDEKGNDVTCHISYQVNDADGETRVWDGRVVARIDNATIDGKHIAITPEMHREGFVFKTHGMQDVLKSSKTDSPKSAHIRQETPDATCFFDGHTASAGKHELGCTCREERAESLKIIHEKGGINCLIPGAGNGNGSGVQERQMMIRNSAVRNNLPIVPFQDVYESMLGTSPDNRAEALAISTFLMEHLFRMHEVNHVTALTDSRSKQNTWKVYNKDRIVEQQPLISTKRDHPDHQHKVSQLGYR